MFYFLMCRTADNSDEALMARFRKTGAEADITPLITRYLQRLYGFAVSMLQDRAEAEDAVQECFIRVIHKRGSFKPSMRFSPWIYAILRNICIDALRHKKRAAAFAETVPEGAAVTLPDPVEDRQALDRAREAISRLEEPDRGIILHRIFGELDFADIAAIYKMSADAVKKRVYRALKAVREELKAYL